MTFAWWHVLVAIIPILPNLWGVWHIWSHDFNDDLPKKVIWLMLCVFLPVVGGLLYLLLELGLLRSLLLNRLRLGMGDEVLVRELLLGTLEKFRVLLYLALETLYLPFDIYSIADKDESLESRTGGWKRTLHILPALSVDCDRGCGHEYREQAAL